MLPVVYAVIGVCMSVSTLLSIWASWKSTSSRLKVFFFLVASLVGVILVPILGGLLIVLFPDQRQSILAAARGEAWTAICLIVAMAWFGMWRFPQLIAEQSERRRDQSR
jgi:hypothetical protein